jgi:MiaB/RimO family radical SAM methylthiotransferase
MEKGVEQIKKGLEKLPKNIYTKKFVLIQWWCDSFCTFCLTVKKRWKHFSRSKEDILNEILEFEKKDWKEVVLTWINLSAWWLENTNDVWKTKFAELIWYILENTKIPRIRISSMWPEFINDDVLKLFENTRIYPHFHYSVQSGSNKILKAMGRHYDWKYIKNLLEKTRNIKRKDGIEISIWADIIVWFPWETKEDFKNTFDLIKDTKVSKLHAFPFSWHKIWENVTAWNFPNQINDKVKKERMFDIINLSDKIRKKFINNNVWKELEVLIEYFKMDKKNWRIKWKWWTQNYIEANESNFQILSGIIKRNNIIKGKLIK